MKIGSSKFNQINIVPFIDVMLVLLTIVLTTATFIAKGIIPVDLPEAKESQSLGQQKQIEIAIKEDGKIYYDGDIVSIAELKDRVTSVNKKDSIIIKSDKKSAFENFVSVLEILKSNNFENISILTKK
ncbi:MAG: TonB system transport protein ExbD, partial [Campylobacterales bacterium]